MPKSLCGVLFILAGVAAYAQPGAQKIFIEPRARVAPMVPPSDAAAHLRVDASLVLIHANVSNEKGASITSLRRDNFRIFEDGEEREITYFAMEDAPVSVGLLIDTSGSMGNKMRQAAAAASEFLKTAGTQDEFFLVEFNEKPKLVVPFGVEPEELLKRVSRARPFGRTSLLDAVQMGVAQMKKARHTRRAIVILSDGADNRSRSTPYQTRMSLVESGAQLYAMGIFDSLNGKGTLEEQNGPKLLDELTAASGGHHFRAGTPDDLPGIAARIGMELHSQYLIGYSPAALQADGKYHRVKLQLAAPPDLPALRVHYRSGYFAPER
jgi:Ca-activated chloride channel homolog